MKSAVRSVLCVCVVLFCASFAAAETYGNFTTMGLIADCPADYAPADIAAVKAYLVTPDGRRPVHELVQVAEFNYYAGSLWWLTPDTPYTVDVEFLDSKGAVISKSTETGRTRPEPIVLQTAKSLYVATDGLDTNPGTSDEPFRTLAAAFAKVTPGTTLFIRSGVYYEGSLTIPASASQTAPIVVRAVPGESVTLDGAEPALVDDSAWRENSIDDTQWGNGTYLYYSAPFEGQTWNVSVEEKGTGKCFRLYPLRTKEELLVRRSADKTFDELGFTGAYHCDGKTIFIVLPRDPIKRYLIHVARETQGVILENRDFVSLSGLTFIHYGKDEYGCAVAMRDSSECLIDNCSSLYCNTGVWIKGESSNNTVQDSRFFDDTDHWHFSYSKGDEGWNYHGQVETGAVVVDGKYSGRGLVVRRNHIQHMFDGAHLCPYSEINARTSETDWCDNTLLDIIDDFVETDGISRNVRIFNNYMNSSLSGVSLAQALDGPTWIIYNVIANCGTTFATTNAADYPYEGYPFKTNGGPRPEVGSGPIFFYHNSAWTSDVDSRAILIKSSAKWRVLVMYNNIWFGRAAGFDCWREDPSPIDWDYDDLYARSGDFFKQRTWGDMPNITEFRIHKNAMLNGISEDPRYDDPEDGDFHLRNISPCIDKGVVLDGINDTIYEGAAPDMGCYETDFVK